MFRALAIAFSALVTLTQTAQAQGPLGNGELLTAERAFDSVDAVSSGFTFAVSDFATEDDADDAVELTLALIGSLYDDFTVMTHVADIGETAFLVGGTTRIGTTDYEVAFLIVHKGRRAHLWHAFNTSGVPGHDLLVIAEDVFARRDVLGLGAEAALLAELPTVDDLTPGFEMVYEIVRPGDDAEANR